MSFFSGQEGILCIVSGPEGSPDVLVGECTSPGARFAYDSAARRIRSLDRPGYCLDGTVGGEPTLLVMRPCAPDMIESWTWSEAKSEIRGSNGCIGAVGAVDYYAKLSTQPCNTEASGQRWVLAEATARATERAQAAKPAAQAQAQAPQRKSSLVWSRQQNGAVGKNPTLAGYEADQSHIYLCLAPYANGQHIGKIRIGFRGCNIGDGGKEIEVSTYSVLSSPAHWVPANGGAIPKGSPRIGAEADGRPLFACRANFRNGWHPGKIGRDFGGCNIAYGGREHTLASYEVLVD